MPKGSRTALAITIVLALVALGCSTPENTDLESTMQGVEQATGGQPTFDGAAPAAVPTTPPLVRDDEPALPTPAPIEEATPEPPAEEDPWLVNVLHVNDDVSIIPVFDAPNGNEITIRDVNAIDGIETEYPLLAQTVFGNRLALVVEEFDPSGVWAKVEVPVRPNGTTVWVQTGFFRQESHDYHITIDLSDNKVNVYQGDELLIEQIAVSGRESRPTPIVRAYIDEKIRGETLSPAYGDWILSISAFSEVLGTFGGGMPKLALHGTNEPNLMGQYVSSGCVRVPNEVVSFIAETVPVGTIVDIVA